MVFFQAMLLTGYAYAHFIAKVLPLKVQALLHLSLLALFTLVLPLSLPPGAQPPDGAGQEWWQLGIMLTSIGGPFFVLAASAPLFQHWFASSKHEDAENPYFLYAVSNIGSMLSLLGYPVIIEPLLGVREQTEVWFGGYLLLFALTMVCAWMIRNGTKPLPPLSVGGENEKVRWLDRALWIGLSFIPSSLMLGVTSLITTDIASAPFLWIIPLTIYLATFIIAFSTKPLVPLSIARELAPYLIAFNILSFMVTAFVTMQFAMVVLNLLTFYMCAQLCHGELARKRPAPSHLTEYFLLISVGGVMGGIFNALIAPNIFLEPIEYSMVLATIGFIVWAGKAQKPVITLKFNTIDDKARLKKLLTVDLATVILAIAGFLFIRFTESNFIQAIGTLAVFGFLLVMVPNRAVFACTAAVALLLFQSTTWSTNKTLLTMDRNYFGSLKVYTDRNINFLYHGTTLHGAQFQDEEHKLYPVTYYSPGSSASDIFTELDKKKGEQKIGVIGLGVGSVACYAQKGREFDFYEIDEDVVKVAENPKYFSYLSACNSPYNVILGDGRLKLAEKPEGYYDMIFLDAFSSDNIPIHLLTKEALSLYMSRLKPGGILMMNISNRFLDLRRPLTTTMREINSPIYFKYHKPHNVEGDVSELYVQSIFAVAAKDESTLTPYLENYQDWGPLKHPVDVRPWTDDYANILPSLFVWKFE